VKEDVDDCGVLLVGSCGAVEEKRIGLTEEEEECNTVQYQNVRHMSYAGDRKKQHLLLGGAHEEEAGGEE